MCVARLCIWDGDQPLDVIHQTPSSLSFWERVCRIHPFNQADWSAAPRDLLSLAPQHWRYNSNTVGSRGSSRVGGMHYRPNDLPSPAPPIKYFVGIILGVWHTGVVGFGQKCWCMWLFNFYMCGCIAAFPVTKTRLCCIRVYSVRPRCLSQMKASQWDAHLDIPARVRSQGAWTQQWVNPSVRDCFTDEDWDDDQLLGFEPCNENLISGCNIINGKCECDTIRTCSNPFEFPRKDMCLSALKRIEGKPGSFVTCLLVSLGSVWLWTVVACEPAEARTTLWSPGIQNAYQVPV